MQIWCEGSISLKYRECIIRRVRHEFQRTVEKSLRLVYCTILYYSLCGGSLPPLIEKSKMKKKGSYSCYVRSENQAKWTRQMDNAQAPHYSNSPDLVTILSVLCTKVTSPSTNSLKCNQSSWTRVTREPSFSHILKLARYFALILHRKTLTFRLGHVSKNPR